MRPRHFDLLLFEVLLIRYREGVGENLLAFSRTSPVLSPASVK